MVVDVVQYLANGRDGPMEDMEFIASFYEHGLVGTVSEWFKSGMKTEPIELVGQLWLVIDNIKYSLRRSERRKKELENKKANSFFIQNFQKLKIFQIYDII